MDEVLSQQDLRKEVERLSDENRVLRKAAQNLMDRWYSGLAVGSAMETLKNLASAPDLDDAQQNWEFESKEGGEPTTPGKCSVEDSDDSQQKREKL